MNDTKDFNEFGGVRSEKIDNVTIDYDVYGTPVWVEIDVPFNSKGYEAGWSGPDVTVPTDSHVYRDIMDQASSTFYERMKDADWEKLEKHYGNEPEFQESRKRFLEEAKKQSNNKNVVKNADKNSDNANESGLLSTLTNSAENVWETVKEGFNELRKDKGGR